MPAQEKPYRVYRSGRGRTKLPGFPTPSQRPGRDGQPPKPGAPARPGRRRRYGRWFALALGVFLLWLTAWTLASYFSFRDGVKAANRRLPAPAKKALDDQDGLLLTHGTNILLLGTDQSDSPARRGLRHSDSIMLVHTDPDRHRITYLSIPRDLRVEIPGHGAGKINEAFQIGGAPLAIRTVRNLTGLEVDHVAVVDFARFADLIDEVGGIDVNVPAPIRSSRFDCPYSAERCQTWEGWRFEKGRQHMDGKRALVYSRVRSNRLNPADNDITRAERQQQVVQALAGKLASAGTFFDLPFVGGDLLEPLATDLSPGEMMQLGWVYWRSDSAKALHCRLGGTPESGYIISEAEENLAVISMVRGDSAPQPPPPGSGTFGAGCVVGKQLLGSR
jgi:LCP family protein required for cell wall assembly